jgi:DNA-binding NarL/FixJ family response regulator
LNHEITILLVDDHAMVRDMLASRLERETDLVIVQGVGNAEDAIAAALKHKPDIVLMDIDMPGMLCFEAARTIQVQCPGSRIVFLSAFFHDWYIEEAINVKAWGYITKNEPEHVLVKAVRNVAAGIAYFSAEVQARLIVDEQGAHLGVFPAIESLHPDRARD